jgi:hypothetical protein
VFLQWPSEVEREFRWQTWVEMYPSRCTAATAFGVYAVLSAAGDPSLPGVLIALNVAHAVSAFILLSSIILGHYTSLSRLPAWRKYVESGAAYIHWDMVALAGCALAWWGSTASQSQHVASLVAPSLFTAAAAAIVVIGGVLPALSGALVLVLFAMMATFYYESVLVAQELQPRWLVVQSAWSLAAVCSFTLVMSFTKARMRRECLV